MLINFNEKEIMPIEKKASYEELINGFKNPISEYRGKPFWAWNNKLNKEELLAQMETFKKMGMGGGVYSCAYWACYALSR